MLNDLVRDVEHGTIRDQQGSCVATLASEITSRNDQEPCRVTGPDHRPSSPSNQRMRRVIELVHAESGGTYGAGRITRALRRKGVDVARCTVERLLAELGLEGVIRGQRRRTTVAEPSAPRPPGVLDRDFTATRPDQLWVADMRYVRTWSGWAYVAFVLDVYSRMIVGWQVANHMRTELLLDAPEMALWGRRVKKDSGLIHHSDRGSPYVSIRYTERLSDVGLRPRSARSRTSTTTRWPRP
ncbi:IS3 family transposase [Streptomyces sp. 5K101]|uniref:IS3 family transposase n=1 Tax=Streptomyces sp. 5K101 TaxID=3390037 RepID=UPI003975DDA0